MNMSVQRPLPHVSMQGVTAVLLAGGQGTRLHELTSSEAKPAVFFGGHRRIIDFTMANVVQAGIGHLIVATQYQPSTLLRHLPENWGQHFGPNALRLLDGSRQGAEGYRGTAHAVAANSAEIDAAGTQDLLVLSGDHVYQMDYAALIAAHRASGAQVTLAAMTVPLDEARGFGVIKTRSDGRVEGFVEKPSHPASHAHEPGKCLVNMGIYVFDWNWARPFLAADAADPLSSQDFGADILPAAVQTADVRVWRADGDGRAAYWRDVGTLDAFREAHMDFRSATPPFAMPFPEVTSLHDNMQYGFALGLAGLSLRAPRHRPDAPHRWTLLDESVVMPGARLGTGVRLSKVIVAPGTSVPVGLVVGEDPDEDARWFRRTDKGTVLITTPMIVRRALNRPRRHALAPLAGKMALLRA